MKLLSLFDGSGAFPLAAERLGIQARYASEVEPFPIAVTRARFPQMEHLGDVTKINGGEIEPCDMVTFGSLCTSWSIAGLKLGLEGQSGLFFEAIRVMREMLEATGGEYPRFFLFENVPNLLSINKGADWKIVMDAFADLGFICDPNILDSQEFGIAQRRKRIFVAGINRKYYNPDHFADIPNCRAKRMQKAVDTWQRASVAGGEVFHGVTSRPHEIRRQHLSEILERDVDPKYYLSVAACLGILRRIDAKGKKIPQLLRSALEYQAGLLVFSDVSGEVCSFESGATVRLPGGKHWMGIAPTLRAEAHGGDNHPSVVIPVDNHPSDSRIKLNKDGTVQTLTSMMGGGGGNVPLCAEPVAYGISSVSSNSMNSPNPTSGVYETDTAKTLDTSSQTPKNQGGLVICDSGIRSEERGIRVKFAPDSSHLPPAAWAMTTGCFTQTCEEQSPTLTARDFKDAPITNSPHPAPPGYIVRRLTPTECLVLMNLPKNWCDNISIENPTEADYLFWESVFPPWARKRAESKLPAGWRSPTQSVPATSSRATAWLSRLPIGLLRALSILHSLRGCNVIMFYVICCS